MMSATTSSARDIRSPGGGPGPFTQNQWQELEHQALIFKYMVSGVPIPPELIYSVKRSLDSSLASRLFPHQPIGWGCFQVGFGRKTDPEPGRCRRTDGKKWRCSKEAYPDSKYCERHMHRGRNRSRKPVEVSTTASTISATTNPNNNPSSSSLLLNRNLSMNNNNTPTSSYSMSPPELYAQKSTTTQFNPYIYSSSSRTHPQDNNNNNTTHNLFLDSGSYSQPDKDYRYFRGVDERAFFPEAAAASGNNDSYKGYTQAQFQSFVDHNSKQQQEQQHCFVLGSDFKSARTMKIERGDDDETQKPLHHFFGDQWQQTKNTPDSWLDLASNSRVHTDS